MPVYFQAANTFDLFIVRLCALTKTLLTPCSGAATLLALWFSL